MHLHSKVQMTYMTKIKGELISVEVSLAMTLCASS